MPQSKVPPTLKEFLGWDDYELGEEGIMTPTTPCGSCDPCYDSESSEEDIMMTPGFFDSCFDSESSEDYSSSSEEEEEYIDSITEDGFKFLFGYYLDKETKYMVGSGYLIFLQKNQFVAHRRLRAIQWFIQRQRQFGLGTRTVFNALNYLDRFIEKNRRHGWSYEKMELLSLACLSIAVKFCEDMYLTNTELLPEGLRHRFERKLIHKMEEKVVDCLGHNLDSITPYSYVDLIQQLKLNQDFKTLVRPRLDKLLVESSVDVKFIDYRPSVIALSGFKCLHVEENSDSHISSLIPEDEQENMESCYSWMQEILVGDGQSKSMVKPLIPDSVLSLSKEYQIVVREQDIDLSFNDPARKNKRKRRDNDEEGDASVIKYMKCEK